MGSTAIDVVLRTFAWFNSVYETSGRTISREEVEAAFTDDARMTANGQVKCVGITAHLAHFQEMQRKIQKFRIRLPLEEQVSTVDKAAAYYKIEYVTTDGKAGIIHDSAIWEVRDGKIASMTETVYFQGEDVPLDNH